MSEIELYVDSCTDPTTGDKFHIVFLKVGKDILMSSCHQSLKTAEAQKRRLKAKLREGK